MTDGSKGHSLVQKPAPLRARSAPRNVYRYWGNVLLTTLLIGYSLFFIWTVLVPLLDDDTPLKKLIPNPLLIILPSIASGTVVVACLAALSRLFLISVKNISRFTTSLEKWNTALGPLFLISVLTASH
ncbi:hypothetical protein BV898_01171 [Hypsibius exemplaris]|uniref:Dolichol phosphate-mannose biosynthesis regulatory protein n=1 Tax=Hypsibius exemplaris TaxID=2072580 RepID=A0A1W0XCG6_HYPEX|nr:hypothetical protein BV898_01171 [Hypsibius exemplaris]